ncbi:MAG: hypothetical protein V3T79_03885 [Candidatus Scalindua sediminis]
MTYKSEAKKRDVESEKKEMYEKALSELGLFLQYVQNDKRAKDIKKVLLRKPSR